MNFKVIKHRAALLMTLLFTAFLTLCIGQAINSKTVLAASGSDAVTSDDEVEISDQIIVSANNYLSLTACADIDTAPKAEIASEPIPRMVFDATEADIYMIACEVQVESGSEPYEGQLAVANVIVNRILSPLFPDTVEGVIYQEGQFPPAYNGLLSSAMVKGPSESCLKATKEALYGNNNIGDYLYFNMASGVNTAACSRYVQISNQIFYEP